MGSCLDNTKAITWVSQNKLGLCDPKKNTMKLQTLLVLLAIGAATADPFFLSLFGKGNNCECRNYYTKECKAKEDKAG